ncbi:MAG TPA: ABC transporter permease [Burkholderiales bacterium]|nr:ABC transporter permease [Burkholderiales bacterium]
MLKPQYDLAFRDIVGGIIKWQLWTRAGWADVRARYRRTTFGPFWATISLGIMMISMGLVWSALWKMNVKEYLPFISAGLLSWALVSAIISDGTNAFTAQKGLLEALHFPLTMLTCAVVWRNLILFFHNLLVYLLVAVIFQVPVSWATLMVVPALLLIAINGVWVSTLLGMMGARYRDVQQLIVNLLQIAMFLTPIFWTSDQLGGSGRGKFVLVDLNPMAHYINIIRNPLLGEFPTVLDWKAVLILTVLGWLFTLAIFARFRRRITYWL